MKDLLFGVIGLVPAIGGAILVFRARKATKFWTKLLKHMLLPLVLMLFGVFIAALNTKGQSDEMTVFSFLPIVIVLGSLFIEFSFIEGIAAPLFKKYEGVKDISKVVRLDKKASIDTVDAGTISGALMIGLDGKKLMVSYDTGEAPDWHEAKGTPPTQDVDELKKLIEDHEPERDQAGNKVPLTLDAIKQ